MRLIDADKLKHEAEDCIETTDAFIQLIDEQPTVSTKRERQRPERLIPCTCGSKRREHWVGCYPYNKFILKCSRCGFTVNGTSEIAVNKNWNEAIRRRHQQCQTGLREV